jgi:hypothetical protein
LVITSLLPRPVAGMKLRLRDELTTAADVADALASSPDPVTAEQRASAWLAQLSVPSNLHLTRSEVLAGGW